MHSYAKHFMLIITVSAMIGCAIGCKKDAPAVNSNSTATQHTDSPYANMGTAYVDSSTYICTEICSYWGINSNTGHTDTIIDTVYNANLNLYFSTDRDYLYLSIYPLSLFDGHASQTQYTSSFASAENVTVNFFNNKDSMYCTSITTGHIYGSNHYCQYKGHKQ